MFHRWRRHHNPPPLSFAGDRSEPPNEPFGGVPPSGSKRWENFAIKNQIINAITAPKKPDVQSPGLPSRTKAISARAPAKPHEPTIFIRTALERSFQYGSCRTASANSGANTAKTYVASPSGARDFPGMSRGSQTPAPPPITTANNPYQRIVSVTFCCFSPSSSVFINSFRPT